MTNDILDNPGNAAEELDNEQPTATLSSGTDQEPETEEVEETEDDSEEEDSEVEEDELEELE